MPPELVDRFNRLEAQLDLLQRSVPRLGKLIDELRGTASPEGQLVDDHRARPVTLAQVRDRLTRPYFRVGFLGRNQIGKSTTFNNVVGCPQHEPLSPKGNGESTTAAITCVRARREGEHGLRLSWASASLYTAKRRALAAAVDLDASFDEDQLLRELPERQRQIARNEGRPALTEDPKFLRRLILSYKQHGSQCVGRPPEMGDFGRRSNYVSHDPVADAPSPFLLLDRVEIDYRTPHVSQDLELFDLPGLGARTSLDTLLTRDFLKDLDGVLVFVETNHPDDHVVERVFQDLKGIYEGDFTGRVWLVLVRFDNLGRTYLEGTDRGRTVFDNVASLAERHGVPLSQVCLVSEPVYLRSQHAAQGFDRALAAGTVWQLPPAGDVPPQLENYPELREAYEELLADGGIGRLRRLLGGTLVESVGNRQREWAAQKIAEIADRLRVAVEHAQKTRGMDLLPRLHQCSSVIYKQLQGISGRTAFFDGAAADLRDGLGKCWDQLFPQDPYLDAATVAQVAKRFPGDARDLERELDGLMRTRIVPQLYDAIGAALRDLPAVPIRGEESVTRAWAAYGREDAEDLGPWKTEFFPTFLEKDLFLGLLQPGGDELNGKVYRALMQEKVRTGTRQALHVLRQRLRHRLQALEQHLSDLRQIDRDGDGVAGAVDYPSVLAELRSLCPST